MRFKCEIPDCDYETDHRSYVANHHIIPVELGGSDKSWNRLFCCPNHHCRIYIPDATKGIHTIETEDSITILGWRNSRCFLEYIEDGEIKYKESKKWISQMNRSSPRR